MPRGTRKKRRLNRQKESEIRTDVQDLRTMLDQIDRNHHEAEAPLTLEEKEFLARIRKLVDKRTPLTLQEDARLVAIWKRAMGYEFPQLRDWN